MADQNKIVYNIKVNAEQGTATIRDLKGQIVATQVPVDQLRGKFGNFAKQVNAVNKEEYYFANKACNIGPKRSYVQRNGKIHSSKR